MTNTPKTQKEYWKWFAEAMFIEMLDMNIEPTKAAIMTEFATGILIDKELGLV